MAVTVKQFPLLPIIPCLMSRGPHWPVHTSNSEGLLEVISSVVLTLMSMSIQGGLRIGWNGIRCWSLPD